MNFVSQISFLYYRDLAKAVKFYEDIFDFELVVDQNWAKIYKTTAGAHIGLVDEKRGHFQFSKQRTNSEQLISYF